MITKISHMTIFVTDQAQAYEFYVDRLGFKVNTDVTMDNGTRWLTVNPPEQPDLEITLIEPLSGKTSYDEETRNAFRVLLEKGALGAAVMTTPDCKATYQELKDKGVRFKAEPREQFYGTEAIMTDGVGNWFSMTQPK